MDAGSQGPSEDIVSRRMRDEPSDMLLGVRGGRGLRGDWLVCTLGGHLNKGNVRTVVGGVLH